MCGIAGYINFKNKIDNSLKIQPIIKSIKHRGPDNTGYWLSKQKNVILVNTRLAIQDLSKKGNQPLVSQDGRYVIVFNGEIYNFKILTEKLAEFKFQSNSDTEVLLNMYIKYNYKCLDYLDGMFAFAIYDNKEKKIFCARDKFGIKPFYYFYDKKKFCFSSEIKTLSFMGVHREHNNKAVLRYLNSEYHEHQFETFYKNIYKIKSGNYIVIDKTGKFSQKNYFNFKNKYKSIQIPSNKDEKIEVIRKLIFRSVEKSLVADVPISVAASGGLDSSILQVILKQLGKKIDLISFIFKEKKFSEENYIKKISRKTQFNYKTICITPKSFKENLKESINILEEPFSGLPIISYLLCVKELARTKVILDGTGLDEANFGYDKYLNSNVNQNNLNFAQDGSVSVQNNIIHSNLKKCDETYKFTKPFKDKFRNDMYSDLYYLKLPRALKFRDKLGMRFGKEIRPCFLDEELILTLLKLDYQYHYKNGFSKRILRDAFKDDLSKEIAFAKKRNIQTPQTSWLREEMFNWLKNFLYKSEIWDMNWINKDQFYKNLDLFKRKKIHNSFFIWKMINLELWRKI